MSFDNRALFFLFASAVLSTAVAMLPGPYTIFKTEPEFVPTFVNVTKHIDSQFLEPGYFFIAPHIGRKGYGPQIFDQDGQLVWYGTPTVTHIKDRSVYGMDFRVCDYLGEKDTHLCYSESRPKDSEDEGIRQGGANRIFNNAYELVTEFQNMGNLRAPNPHEFNVLPGGESLLQTIYQKHEMDLRPYKGNQNGYMYDGCFQEINIRSRQVDFQWCGLDHLSIDETYLYLHIPQNTVNLSSSTGGKGKKHNPWDFMHLNSIDKNFEGDYLISSRHMSAVMKIAGKNNVLGYPPGKIIWRLNGKLSDFEVQEEAIFTRQHHARYISTTKNETIISIFNNAYDGHTVASRNMSSAMIVKLNNETMKATLDSLYNSPVGLLSMAQGSAGLLPGGNVHVGWGSRPQWSEFSRNGTLLYHAVAESDSERRLTNYRSFKHQWVGRPVSKPKLLAYCQYCNDFSFGKNGAPVHVYVSWNGATEVASWRFFLSAAGHKGPWVEARTVPKTGFETHAALSRADSGELPGFSKWVYVEAVAADGQVIGQTSSKTFVPSAKISPQCNEASCFDPPRFSYDEDLNRSGVCGADWRNAVIVLVLLIFGLESWDQLIRRLMSNLINPPDEEDQKGFYDTIRI